MKRFFIFLFLSFLLILQFIISLYIGPVRIPVEEIFKAIFSNTDEKYEIIINEIRLPRTIMAIITGSCLSISGAILQGIFRNKLLEPYILGISAGASLGLVLSTIYLKTNPIIFSFIFSLLPIFIAYNISKTNGRIPNEIIILAGISISFLFSSIVAFLLYLNAREAGYILMTLMGSLGYVSSKDVIISLITIPIIFMLIFFSKEINILLFGEDYARTTGVNVFLVKTILLLAASFITSVTVSFCGIISFIGLISPHISRIIIGENYVFLLPASILIGSNILLASDIFIRIFFKGEIPISILTSLLGIPIFLHLLIKRKRVYKQ